MSVPCYHPVIREKEKRHLDFVTKSTWSSWQFTAESWPGLVCVRPKLSSVAAGADYRRCSCKSASDWTWPLSLLFYRDRHIFFVLHGQLIRGDELVKNPKQLVVVFKQVVLFLCVCVCVGWRKEKGVSNAKFGRWRGGGLWPALSKSKIVVSPPATTTFIQPGVDRQSPVGAPTLRPSHRCEESSSIFFAFFIFNTVVQHLGSLFSVWHWQPKLVQTEKESSKWFRPSSDPMGP